MQEKQVDGVLVDALLGLIHSLPAEKLKLVAPKLVIRESCGAI